MENNINEQPNQSDLTSVSLIFARALSLIFQHGQGIIVDVTGDVNLGSDVTKVVVFNNNNMIHIQKCEQDLPEGTPVELEGGQKGL